MDAIGMFYFTEEERNYLVQLVELSKESLDDICDERKVTVDFLSQNDVDNEYKLIDNIREKFNYGI